MLINAMREKKRIRPLFSRLLISYSLISVIPILVVWLFILIWGSSVLALVLDLRGRVRIQDLSAEVDTAFSRIHSELNALLLEPVILDALSTVEGDWDSSRELELYTSFYNLIRGLNNAAEVHISDDSGSRRFSTAEYPAIYDVRNYQNRERWFEAVKAAPEMIHLLVGDRQAGYGLAVMLRIDGGFLILDIDLSKLLGSFSRGFFNELYLVDSIRFRSMDVLSPGEPAGFSVQPYLGIVFGDQSSWRPEHEILVHRSDLSMELYEGSRLSLVGLTQMGQFFRTIDDLLLGGLLLLLVLSLMTVFVSYRISRSISDPIHRVVTAMQSRGRRPQKVPETHHGGKLMDELDFLTQNYNSMVDTIRDLLLQVQQEEQALRVAERRAIQAQLNPHFLYNTLGSIKAMAKLGRTGEIIEVVQDLGKILRFSLSDSEAMVALSESLDQVRRYINIQKRRFSERMTVSYDVDPVALELMLPKMLLQPLVENALVHGVEKTAEHVNIIIRIRILSDELLLEVQDDGPGPQPAGVRAASGSGDQAVSEGFGIGMDSISALLNILYGAAASLRLDYDGILTTAEIRISLEKLE
ncbi:sensor histidine kinase [Spirochaeta dissipatitropha]